MRGVDEGMPLREVPHHWERTGCNRKGGKKNSFLEWTLKKKK